MAFKFEKLEVWHLALDYIDLIYKVADQLPRSEDHNLKSQIVRAATSVALNIAEGSTGQSDSEQARFLGMSIRSLVETVACQHIIVRRKLLPDMALVRQAYNEADNLAKKRHAMRKAIAPERGWLREEPTTYMTDDGQQTSDDGWWIEDRTALSE